MIMKPLVYKTPEGRVLQATTAHPHSMPWVGQKAIGLPLPEGLKGPLVVEEVHGDGSGYVAVVKAI